MTQDTSISTTQGDIKCDSAFFGTLTAIDIHQGYQFTIHNLLGEKINCSFDKNKELLKKAKKHLGKKVHIYGVAHYVGGNPIPKEVKVNNIDEYRPPKKEVKFLDIYGMAPNATSGKSALDFLGNMRGKGN